MQAIIPVAGAGTKLRPHTHTQPKPLIPVAGKPILGHILDNLIEAGVNDFVFVIGYLGEKIEEYIRDNYGKNITTQFVIQGPREGLAHAISMTEMLIKPDPKGLLIVLGDTILDVDYLTFLESKTSILGVDTVEDPRKFGVVRLNSEGFIESLAEKPTIPKSNLALAGIYKILETELLFEAIHHLIENGLRTQTEYHLTDALMWMVEKGVKIKTQNVNKWFDCGKKDALLETNAILLKKPEFTTTHDGQFENSIIIAPVNIAKNVKIINSIIGPNVSIGQAAEISNSIVKESIIGPEAHIIHVVLHDSLIGNEATLHGISQSLNVGDSAEINFGG
jgi:glucose-1-phosphate thymidylyltransferase